LKNTEFFGFLSAFLVCASIIPYAYRVWQKKITPQLVSWILWSFIGISLLLTYNSSGAESNVWPAVFGFTNPTLIVILLLWKRNNEIGKIEGLDKYCLLFGLISLASWFYFRSNPKLVQYSLYVGLVADLFAAISTIKFVWKNPIEERPFAWVCYSIGYGLGMLAITEHTIANYSLPIYMCIGSMTISLPLIIYRIKTKAPLKEWI